MKLDSLPKTTTPKKKRLGRGYGSGVGGHTSTRGMKGQKSRSSVADWFEGGQLPLARRLPFLRGKDRFKTVNTQVTPVNLNQLNKFKKDTKVDAKALVDQGIISEKEALNTTIKILGTGDLKVALTLDAAFKVSDNAKSKIEKAGGSIQS